jgi:hypothetical protein
MKYDWPASVSLEARRYKTAGFNIAEICRIIEREHGRCPSRGTVTYWVDDRYREQRLERTKRRMSLENARTATFRLSSNTPEYQAAFIRRLRAEGTPWQSIVKVCNVVFAELWTVERAQQLATQHDEAAA